MRKICTVFGTVEVKNPRWMLCQRCLPHISMPFTVLGEICPDRATPELMKLTAHERTQLELGMLGRSLPRIRRCVASLDGRRRKFYLSTILDDFSRYIIAWKLCTTMKAVSGFTITKAFRTFGAIL
jgi:hypothetical protein